MPGPTQDEQEKAHLSTLALSVEREAAQGYGACSSSGCNCQGYGGSGDTCTNCGHNFTTHW
jgi:hypothetical protein